MGDRRIPVAALRECGAKRKGTQAGLVRRRLDGQRLCRAGLDGLETGGPSRHQRWSSLSRAMRGLETGGPLPNRLPTWLFSGPLPRRPQNTQDSLVNRVR